jgi:hypothetical protein
MHDVPQEPLRPQMITQNQRSHALANTRYGPVLAASKYPLYLGIVLLIIYVITICLLPSSVWEYLDRQMLGKTGKYIIMLPLLISCAAPMLIYKLLTIFGIRVEFDQTNDEIRITKRKKSEKYKLSDLVAMQVCFALRGTKRHRYYSHELNLVFQKNENGYFRYCIMNCGLKRSVFGIGQNIAKRLYVPFLDHATDDHKRAEQERFEKESI